ncbi:hypothetical protein [Microbacterium sp. ZOR0019]|uniref:hypothetical protein n=1 Tax=Microbacterium sp. ZOR0019 TaxID=1339233 RepID=UPI000645D5EB|nr:hypothetical protein [Microbacterium sp. ZOR0019]
MTASPKGYPFERIDYDVGQLNSLHGHLEDAAAEVAAMQLVLRNVTDNLEGRGQALDQAKAMAGDVAAAFASPAARISEANLPIGAVVNDGGYLQDGSESFANIANIINYGEPLTTDDR